MARITNAKAMSGIRRRWIAILSLIALAGSASLAPVSAQDSAPGAADPGAFTPLAPGPVVVVLTSGEQLRGELIEDRPGSVTLRVADVEVRVPRDRVEAVYPENDLMERYRLLREAIPADDVERILFLAEWLRRNGMYDEALAEANSALSVEPANGDAIRLKQLIEQQIRLRERSSQRRSERTDEDRRATDRLTAGSFPLLSERDANLIKVYEVDLRNPPRLLVERETIDRLLDWYGGRLGVPATSEGRAAFQQKAPAEILESMFRLRARDLYGDVRVLDLPESLRRFRDNVNSTWVVNSCATTKCHGGPDGGRLMLYNRRPSADRSFLTNLLILERYTLRNGAPMINYDSPASSPLLQMTLPRHESLFPHPEVEGWRPTFTGTSHRRFRQAVAWIESMYKPRPAYPIEYTAPTGRVRGPDDGGGDPDETGNPDGAPIER